MRLVPENYKGIEFVRISSLPENQRALFWKSFDKHKIIKILMADSLLNDCIQYHDYTEWHSHQFKHEIVSNPTPVASTPLQPVLKVA
jgi:hypothetical protein